MPERPDGERYVLGHTPRELDRLDLQGLLYRSVTRRALLDGGVEEGMRVLDLGSGSGDVAFLAAEIVGDQGAVVGVERDASAVAAARERALRRGVTQVAFHVGEIGEGLSEAPFDALVGRFVLMHQPDPSAVLASAVRNIRPGGPVILVESHMELLEQGVHSWPFSPAYDRVVRWKSRVVRAAGADVAMGLKLRRTYLEAGLPDPTTRLEAQVEGGPNSALYGYLAESVASMLPMALRCGIEGFDAEGVEALEDALRAEVTRAGGVLVNWPVVSAWSTVPPP
jgi:ubiquinone/menaquinone biosynthesis C-methylase UbiE